MGTEQPIKKYRQPDFNRRRLFGVFVAAVLLAVLLLGRPFAAFSDDYLFSPAADSPSLDAGSLDATRRARAVRINWNILNPQTDQLRLNLFEDANLVADLQRIDRSITGGYVWVGDIRGEAGGAVTLSVQDGVLSGSVHRFGGEWAVIQYAGQAQDDVYWVREVDPLAPQPNGQDFVIPEPDLSEMQSLPSQEASCREDGSVIDLMIVYTGEARALAGGQDAMEALINRRISEMNTANDKSVVKFDWRLVHQMEVNYSESGSIETDLQNLMLEGDGILETVHGARDQHMADLVAMLISEGSNGACGYAYQMLSLGTYFESYGFGVTALDYADPFSCNELTLAHEIGHNFGNAHDRGHAFGSVINGYAYGFRSPNKTFRDIMAYDCDGGCPRINQWSNPNVWYMGEPTGVDFAVDPANASDVARNMNEVRVEVSNFRNDCVEPTPTATGTPTDVPIPTDTPTASLTPTQTAIPTHTDTPTVTATPTQTLKPTKTPKPTITPTGTLPTPTKTAVPTATTPPTRTPRPTPTADPQTLPGGNKLFFPVVRS